MICLADGEGPFSGSEYGYNPSAQGSPKALCGWQCTGDTENTLYGRTADREWPFKCDPHLHKLQA